MHACAPPARAARRYDGYSPQLSRVLRFHRSMGRHMPKWVRGRSGEGRLPCGAGGGPAVPLIAGRSERQLACVHLW